MSQNQKKKKHITNFCLAKSWVATINNNKGYTAVLALVQGALQSINMEVHLNKHPCHMTLSSLHYEIMYLHISVGLTGSHLFVLILFFNLFVCRHLLTLSHPYGSWWEWSWFKFSSDRKPLPHSWGLPAWQCSLGGRPWHQLLCPSRPSPL